MRDFRISTRWLEAIQYRFNFRIVLVLGTRRTYRLPSGYEIYESPVVGLRLLIGKRAIARFFFRAEKKYPFGVPRPGVDA